MNSCPPDEGVCIELGLAIALGKPTFLFRDDFRRVTDSEEYPLNLMLFTAMPEDSWRDYYHTSVLYRISQKRPWPGGPGSDDVISIESMLPIGPYVSICKEGAILKR